jgi:CRP-like cAMP-binding protein
MTTIIEKVLQLQDLDTFRFAYTEHLAQLASICREEEHAEGDPLFQRGEACNTLHLLVEGKVNLALESGKSVTVQKCSLDQWSFFAHSDYQYSATCAENCLLYTVSYQAMVDLLTAEPEFSWALTRHLAELGRKATVDTANSST